ncbi:MAG: hypothetical protein EOL97_14710 [Spirochaetia bacterium]|nr:hypothetical protein [Spirochaetia bacterium]
MNIKNILIFFKDNIKEIKTTIFGLLNILVIVGVSVTPVLQESIDEILTALVVIDSAVLTMLIGKK